MEVFHDVNSGFGPGPWVPGPLGLLFAMEIFHDEILRFGSRSLGPRPFGLVIAMVIFHEAQVPGSQPLQGNIP